MSLTILPTLLFMAALTAAAMVLWRCWAALVPACRALRAELDGAPESLPVSARLTLPSIRKRSFGPFPMAVAPRSFATQPMRAPARQKQRVRFA